MSLKNLYLGVGNECGYTSISSRKFSHILQENLPKKSRFKFEILKEETHISITTVEFINGLKFIYEGYNIEKLAELDDLVESHFEMLSERFGYRIPIPEFVFQKFTTEQIGEREFDYALFILEKYNDNYPDSPNMLSQFAKQFSIRKQGFCCYFGSWNQFLIYHLQLFAISNWPV